MKKNWVFACALVGTTAALAGACNKIEEPPAEWLQEDRSAQRASGDSSKNDTSKSVEKASSGSEGQENLKPPTAKDLAEYVKGIPGKGKLFANIKTTMGDISCELFEKKVPMTVANFVGLARGLKTWKDPNDGSLQKKPLYDGVVFHRVIPDFMVQTGDPLGRGVGGPGYKFADEFDATLRHDKPGILSMANAGPGTNGSQFFITERPTPHLDGKHTVFGECDNVALVKKITRVEKDPADPSRSRPKDPIKIKSISFLRHK